MNGRTSAQLFYAILLYIESMICRSNAYAPTQSSLVDDRALF